MKKEYQLVFIVGLFLFAYILDAIVDPMELTLATPYHYLFSQEYLFRYAFSTTSIVIKTAGLVWTTLWAVTFIEKKYALKTGIVLVVSALMQLYALQDVATDSHTVPLEWGLSFALCGLLLIPVIIFYLFKNLFVPEGKNQPQDNGPLPESVTSGQKNL